MPNIVRRPLEPSRLEGIGAPNPANLGIGAPTRRPLLFRVRSRPDAGDRAGGWDGGGARQPEGGSACHAAEPGGAMAWGDGAGSSVSTRRRS
jgi:hypothetical protein